MTIARRLDALERALPAPHGDDACPGCGQLPEERIYWKVSPGCPNCAVCGAAEITWARYQSCRGRSAATAGGDA
jgi:hypothetical protein